jgi:hypothetical protein
VQAGKVIRNILVSGRERVAPAALRPPVWSIAMSATAPRTRPPRGFWIVGFLALMWNLIGVMTYVMTVTMSQETIDGMPDAERALSRDVPAAVSAAYAIAVAGGTLGSLGLLLGKAWAVPLYIVSLTAIAVQMGHALFVSPLLEAQGAGAAVLPLVIVVVNAFLLWYAMRARRSGWLV